MISCEACCNETWSCETRLGLRPGTRLDHDELLCTAAVWIKYLQGSGRERIYTQSRDNIGEGGGIYNIFLFGNGNRFKKKMETDVPARFAYLITYSYHIKMIFWTIRIFTCGKNEVT